MFLALLCNITTAVGHGNAQYLLLIVTSVNVVHATLYKTVSFKDVCPCHVSIYFSFDRQSNPHPFLKHDADSKKCFKVSVTFRVSKLCQDSCQMHAIMALCMYLFIIVIAMLYSHCSFLLYHVYIVRFWSIPN